jgi:hypothetical protein
MKTRILLAGLALFAFTTIGVAQETAKKAEAPAKTGCGAECGKAKEGEKKTCCDATKTDKAPTAKTTKTAPAKTQPKK